MRKLMALITVLATIAAVITGLLVYLDIENVLQYHLIAALSTLGAVLISTHMLFYSNKATVSKTKNNTED